MSEPSPRGRRPGELAFALLLAAFAAVAAWQSWRISGFSKLSSPGVFPMLASGAMLVAALFTVRDAARAKAIPGARLVGDVVSWRLVVVVALLVGYVLALPRLGFLAASALFLMASLSYLWRRPWWAALGVTIGSLLALHVVFRVLFRVVLPQGAFDAWLAGLT